MALLIALLALLVGAIVFGAFWVFFGSTTSPGSGARPHGRGAQSRKTGRRLA